MFSKARISRKLSSTLKLIESYGDHGETSLTVTQFMVIAVMEQLHAGVFVQYFDNFLAKKKGVMFLATLLQMLFIKIPLHFFFLFLGSYTKRKVLRLFRCVPIFKGMGFVLLFARNFTLVYNHFFSSTYVYIYSLLRQNNAFGENWLNCKFTEATNSCVPLTNNASVNCKSGSNYEVSLFQYFRIHIFQQEEKDVLNIRLVVINWCIWLAAGAVLFLGLTRLINLFIVGLYGGVSLAVLIMIPLMANAPALKFSSLHYVITANAEASHANEHALIFWTNSIIQCARPLQLASTIWLGALKPPEAKLTVCTIGIFVFAILFLLFYILYAKISLDYYLFRHWNVYKACPFPIYGRDIFVTNLEHFLQTDQPELWMSAYLMVLTVYSCIQNFLSAFVITDSIIDAYPQLGQNRFITCLAFCMTNFLLSLVLTSSMAQRVLQTWLQVESIILGTLIIAVITICFNYIYTLDMILADHVFVYYEEPSALFKHIWSMFPILALLMLCVGFEWLSRPKNMSLGSDIKVICCVATFLILSPLILCFLVELAKGISHEGEHPDRPERDWGPADPEERNNRNKFIPFRNLCYRHTSMTCNHDCLSKVTKYSGEVDLQKKKYEDALKLIALRKSHNKSS